MAEEEEVYSMTARVGDLVLKLNPVFVSSSFRLGGLIDDGFSLRARIGSYAGLLHALREAQGRDISIYIEACTPLTDCHKIHERLVGETGLIVENADFFFKKRMLGNVIHAAIRQLESECHVLGLQGKDNELYQSRMRLKQLRQHIQRRSLLVEVRV